MHTLTHRIIAALLAALSFASTSFAEIILLEVDDTKPGTFLVTISTDGKVTSRPTKVVKLNTGSNPTTPDTGDPNFPDLKPLTATIKRLTDEAVAAGGSKTTAAAIASVYSLVADRVQSGDIALSAWPKAIKDTTDAILGLQPDKDKWVDYRNKLSTSIGALQQAGELDTKEKVAAVLKAVSAGMNQSTGFQPALHGNRRVAMAKAEEGILDGIDIEQIIKLIELIMTILNAFKN